MTTTPTTHSSHPSGDEGPDAHVALRNLISSMGEDPGLADCVRIAGEESRQISRYRIGTAAAVALGAYGAATAGFWQLRSGESQDVSVDIRRATQGLNVSGHTRRDGAVVRSAGPTGASLTTGPMPGCFPCADGRWIMLVVSSARPHQMERTLEVLNCSAPDQIEGAVASWNGAELEEAIYDRGAVAGFVRTAEEWDATPQGRHMVGRPLIQIDKIGEAHPRPRSASAGPGGRPLDGVRVLDATHIIAGPMVTRTLAEQGGDVLHVTRPVNYDPAPFLIDFGVGKRNTVIDLDSPGGKEHFHNLARTADVVVQSYRPGALAARGFSADRLADENPGIIMVSVSCFGGSGAIGMRRGVDPVAQAVTGLAVGEAASDGKPQMNYMWTLTDPLVGYLGATGTMAALGRQAREGGSYHVQVSLVGCAMWLRTLGRSGGQPVAGLPLGLSDLITPRTVDIRSPIYSMLTYLAPIVDYSRTPARWDRPPEPASTSAPQWTD